MDDLEKGREYVEEEFIDITPTWSEILNCNLQILEYGPAPARALAEKELRRMAEYADLWVMWVKENE